MQVSQFRRMSMDQWIGRSLDNRDLGYVHGDLIEQITSSLFTAQLRRGEEGSKSNHSLLPWSLISSILSRAHG